MRKKQNDFQKVKLKVGKQLPKGRNETKTSFQTRKVNLHQQIKKTADEPTLKELLSYMKSRDAKIKFDNMRRLFKHISNNKETLPIFFADILKELGRTLQESDPKIRAEAILIIGLCAEILTDTQLRPFVTPLTTYLNCMMTHITFQVRQDSLKFLDVLLKTHKCVICQSCEILFSLLNLISCKANKDNEDRRKLLDFITPKISTDEWRMNVLKRMLPFLPGVLKNDPIAMDTDDTKKVHWNAKEPLNLPLYLNSGTKPANFDYSLYSLKEEDACDPEELKKFVSEILPILHAILKGFALHSSFSESNIKYLNIFTQIMCCLAEWTVNSDLKNTDISEQCRSINLELMDNFPYIQHTGHVSKGEVIDNIDLNLGICYLHCICSLLTLPNLTYGGYWNKIRSYAIKAFKAGGVKLSEKSISLLVKIFKIGIKTHALNQGAITAVLLGFMTVLKARKISPSANEIYYFFMDLTLDCDIKNFNKLPPIREWFSNIPNLLCCMMDTNRFVPNYLNYLKQLCARRNYSFLNVIGTLPSERFIEFLKFEDEELQITTIQMITSRSILSPAFLQDIAEAIRDECFSLKTASRLIRCLHSRFSQTTDVPGEQMEFVKFLLNLACDTFLILDPSLDTDTMPLRNMLVVYQQSFSCRCEIYPTSNHAFQQEIFKVCAECLSSYFTNELHVKAAIVFIRTIFEEYSSYPVHSAVAFVQLFKRFPILNSDGESAEFLQNIIYSLLLYNSLLTDDVPEEHWDDYNVSAVNDCLDIINTLDIIDYMESAVDIYKPTQVYHVLRSLMFLYRRGYLHLVQKDTVFLLLDRLSEHGVVRDNSLYKNMIRSMFELVSNI
ncbi:testis-expressed protein 10 homolog isoform X2 [Argiope bruennichi]|uniref:testis-expressed protein 10 homolog isoform X2 n=1 Tax=Argiope bruennichi TaxID=94029 RepID=UPI00249560AD|nr:testis-expressed protein 10 homolog isoform X2 [Argiope bruennichi]